MSFVGGKLKLKGGEPLKASGAVKKKKKKASSSELARRESDPVSPKGSSEAKKTLEGYALPEADPATDRRTEAEKRHDEKMRKLEEERLRKLAAKGYRERVKEFNDHLANLSEHHDIPKVGPG
jgi:protein FAM32A